LKKNLKTTFIVLIIAVLSTAAGGYIAVKSLRSTVKEDGFSLTNGCWQYNPKMDLNDNRQRSLIALIGLFALRESEVIYFIANEDTEGRPLDTKYNYEMIGTVPSARYWSYTLYGDDYFLVANDANKFGYNMESIEYLDKNNKETANGTNKAHRVTVSREKIGENWLPMGEKNQEFGIVLRLYNPAPEVYNNLSGVELPQIRRMDEAMN
jgi:hypothetical protein